MDLLPVWFCIVGSVVLAAVVMLPATMILQQGNRDKLAELMAAHERNLKSSDPQTVADSKERWETMCRFLKKSRHAYRHGEALEAFGREAEEKYGK
jgi:hypothetical protein